MNLIIFRDFNAGGIGISLTARSSPLIRVYPRWSGKSKLPGLKKQIAIKAADYFGVLKSGKPFSVELPSV
jgi:hypothetical protein